MRYYVETSLYNFEAWSGGKQTLDELDNADLDAVEQLIDELSAEREEGWSDTDINDFLWFESDIIARHLGYDDWEAYCNRNEDEDEDEEESED